MLALVSIFVMASGARAQETDTPGISPGEALVVEEDDGGRYWRLVADKAGTRPKAFHPRSTLRADVEGCVNVGYVIRPDGKPDAFRVLKFRSTRPSREIRRLFASVAREMIQRSKQFEPGPENPQRLPGFASMPLGFGVGDSASESASHWTRECRIPDLGEFMRSRAEAADA